MQKPTTLITAALLIASVLTGDAGAAGPMLPDFPIAGSPCPVGTGSTIRLSDVIPDNTPTDAAGNLLCPSDIVQDAIFDAGQGGTVIVDLTCSSLTGLRLPSRFTLQGNGLGSNSVLHFNFDGPALSMCQESPRGYVTIQDLDLYGSCPFNPMQPGATCALSHATGIAIANQNIVAIKNVRVSNFQTGISGHQSYSVFINDSNISDNRGDNIRIGSVANGWRIRDGLVSQAGHFGINAFGHNDLLIDGVRMESNRQGAIRAAADSARIINNRFEFNGQDAGFRAILVESDAVHTRILTNYFSGNCLEIEPGSVGTQRAFNMPASMNMAVCP